MITTVCVHGGHSTVILSTVVHGTVVHGTVIGRAVSHFAITHGSAMHAAVVSLRGHARWRQMIAHGSARQIHCRQRLAAKRQQRKHSNDHFGSGNTHAQLIQFTTGP